MFADGVDKALDFLSEETDSLHVFWHQPGFQRWLDEQAIVEATPEGKASSTFRRALFGSHPYRLDPTTAEMRKVTEKETESWFERTWRPANAALIVVGEIDAENVLRQAERYLGGWKGDAAPPPAPPAPPALPAPAPRAPPDVIVAGSGAARTVYTEDARRRTSDIQFGCFLPPVRTGREETVSRLLASLLNDGLRSHLRWRKAVSYSPQVRVETARGGTSWISGRIDVDARAQADALELLHAWLDDGAAMPIDPKRFEQLRWYTARRSGLMNATGQQMASSLFEAWNMGWEPGVLDDYARDLANVTVKDVNASLEVCRRSAVISVLGPAPDPEASNAGP
jgi:predicted Zn-dependent peptidase